MKEIKFKTNINCTGCLSKVKPVLDAEEQIEEWNVDLESKGRLLTVKTENMNTQDVKIVLEKVGFNVEKVNEEFNLT